MGQLRAALRSAMEEQLAAGAPGVILAVEAPPMGVRLRMACGRFQRDAVAPLRAHHGFRAASVTKAVTAASAVRLAASGCWSLDAPVARFLSPALVRALRGMDGLDTLEALTLRRLLDHTSGLPDYFFDPDFQSRVAERPQRTWSPHELAEAAARIGTLMFPVGSGFAYGDSGYVLVGLAIEGITGRPLAEAYRSLVFGPLRMNSTYLEWREAARGSELSHHYDGDEDLRHRNLSFDWAGGGLVTTAGDLVRFLRGLFGGSLLNRHWRAEITRWRDTSHWRPGSSARYLRYGLGLGVNRAAGAEIWGATGVWGAFAYFCPELDAAIAGTVNRVGADRSGLLDAALTALRNASRSTPPDADRVRDAWPRLDSKQSKITTGASDERQQPVSRKLFL